MAALVDDERVTDGQAGMERGWRAELLGPLRRGSGGHRRRLGRGEQLDRPWASVPCWCRCRPCPAMAAGRHISRASSSPRSRSSRTKASRPRPPGPALSARPSSCRRRICGWRWTAGDPNLIDSSVPDALASTANFLKHAGWNGGMAWGYEVRLPAKCRRRGTQEQARPVALGRPGHHAGRRPALPASDAQRRCCCPAGRGGPRRATSTRSIPITRPETRAGDRAPVRPLRGGGRWSRPGRLMIRGCRAPSGANCRLC